MKIYNKVVLDIETGETLEEDSFEYYGPLCEAKGGGGGSSGGGGTSGAVDYPEYMKTRHESWLGAVTTLITTGANPYTGETSFNPDSDITTFLAALAVYDSEVEDMTDTWSSLLTTISVDSTTQINDAIIAYAALLDDRLTTEVLPRFQTGMRDINAVISSTFVLGQAVLEAFNTRDVADFSAKLNLQNITLKAAERADALNLLQAKMQFRESVTKTVIEARRIKVVMKKEEVDEQLSMDDKEYRYPLELYQYGGNIMGSIAGSSVSTPRSETKSSTLGGALSGAAGGAMIGSTISPGVGTLVGAGIGAVLGGIF